MAEAAIRTTTMAEDAATAIDRGQLARLTFGDQKLQRELLALFDRQAELLLARMAAEEGPSLAALAHTMKGSALGIGASRVAEAAAAVERDASAPALNRLRTEVAAVCAEIARF